MLNGEQKTMEQAGSVNGAVVPAAAPTPPAAPPAPASHHRKDIQILRAYAIILVLCQHFGVGHLPGSFLGLDVFFVISGFLVARLIEDDLAAGKFTFRKFYMRRVRRLVPASATTLALTALFAPLFLDGFEYAAFRDQLLSSLAMGTNIVLWQQTDYFGSGAHFKPLLHYWSLAVEEQFYLILPLAFVLIAARWRLALVTLASLISLALCLYLQPRSPSATFYFLPTRMWEFGLGVALALAVSRGLIAPGRYLAGRLLACAVLTILPLTVNEANHPGWAAIVVCLACGMLLMPGSGTMPRWTRPLEMVGDRAYSLYLLHWPVIAFVSNVYIGPVPRWLQLALLSAVVVMAEVQYRFVEQVFQRGLVRQRYIWVPVAAAVVAAGGTAWHASHDRSGAQQLRAANMGLGYGCTDAETYVPRRACATSADPQIMVWGDSLAMHLVQGLDTGGGVAQATRWICGPMLGLAPVNRAYSRLWGEGCLRWNHSVMDSLQPGSGPDVIVLSSLFAQYLPDGEAGWTVLAEAGGQPGGAQQLLPRDRERVLVALDQTVRALRAKGKRVVLFAPPPTSGFDIGRCMARVTSGLPTVAQRGDCRFTRAEFEQRNHAVQAFLQEVQRRNIVPVIDIADALCGSQLCWTRQQAVILYRDDVHLTAEGSRKLGQSMGWATLVDRVAR